MALDLLTRADIPEDAITVSPSQANAWYTCRYRWKLSRIDGIEGLPVREIGAQNKGLMFHSLQEWYYGHFIGKQVLGLLDAGQAAALKMLQEKYRSDADLWSVFTIWLLYTEWASKYENIVPLAVERETFAPLGMRSRDGRPIYLHGFIDLVGEFESKLVVVDHKSHTSRPWDDARVNYDHQFIMYWLMLELQGYPVDLAIVNSVDLAISKNGDKFRAGLRSPERYDRFKRFYRTHKNTKLQYYLDQIKTMVSEMWVRPDPVYDMRLSNDCKWCSYQAHIELESSGTGDARVALRNRFNQADFSFEDDTVDA